MIGQFIMYHALGFSAPLKVRVEILVLSEEAS